MPRVGGRRPGASAKRGGWEGVHALGLDGAVKLLAKEVGPDPALDLPHRQCLVLPEGLPHRAVQVRGLLPRCPRWGGGGGSSSSSRYEAGRIAGKVV